MTDAETPTKSTRQHHGGGKQVSPSEYALLQMWEEFMLAQGRSEKTLQLYRYALMRLASQTKPAKPLTEITEQDVVVFLASLAKRASSRQLYMRAFNSFFGWAFERGHIPVNPASRIRPKAPTERAPDAFSPEEVGALMTSARTFRTGERDALAIQLCYALGLRRSELCRIEPGDVDWAGRRVYIRPSKGDKDRWVEMNDIASDALNQLQGWYNGTVIGAISPQWFSMVVHRAAKVAGFPVGRRNAHMLRAAFATSLLGEGVPISVVSRILGHSSIEVTARYLGVRAKDRHDAVARLVAPG
jgi:site-specific recombinase XerD